MSAIVKLVVPNFPEERELQMARDLIREGTDDRAVTVSKLLLALCESIKNAKLERR